MAVTGKEVKEKKGDTEVPAFQVTFTNGTYQQLKDLSTFLRNEKFGITEDPTDVVKLAISFLLSAKQQREEKEPHE